MKRRVFAILAALSLVLCLAIAGVWVRSYWFYDRWVMVDTFPRYVNIQMSRGEVAIFWSPFTDTPEISFDFAGFAFGQTLVNAPSDSVYGEMGDPGLLTARGLVAGGDPMFFGALGVFPFWLPVLLFAVLPGWWLIALIRKRRQKQAGLCTACGYDLRASKGTCPECGAAIPEGGPKRELS